VNLAPFSYFNLVSGDPACVIYCPNGWKSGVEGVVKDSLANVEATGEFVFNLCTEALSEQMNATSAHLPASIDEMAEAGLAAAPSVLVKPPRVASSPIALECVLLQAIELPASPSGAPNHMVLGRVVGVHVDDGVIVDGVIDIGRLRPLARLGGLEYATVTADAVFAMRRPD
jgi:flavin reductase (DIM6/NTAB) family NADH-FMN oxidoreductase RutF